MSHHQHFFTSSRSPPAHTFRKSKIPKTNPPDELKVKKGENLLFSPTTYLADSNSNFGPAEINSGLAAQYNDHGDGAAKKLVPSWSSRNLCQTLDDCTLTAICNADDAVLVAKSLDAAGNTR